MNGINILRCHYLWEGKKYKHMENKALCLNVLFLKKRKISEKYKNVNFFNLCVVYISMFYFSIILCILFKNKYIKMEETSEKSGNRNI